MKENELKYCRMRGLNPNCKIKTYSSKRVCGVCQAELSDLAYKLLLIDELDLKNEARQHNEIE